MYIEFINKHTSIIPLLNNKFDFTNSHITLPLQIDVSNIEEIKYFFFHTFKKFDKILMLDYHGVVDLFDSNELIPSSLDICIISYIGHNLVTKANTINNIIPRIKSNEVKLGIIVYNKNNKPIVGTKGWIIKLLRESLPNLIIYFIDDSIQNIKSVFKVKDHNIHIYYINKFNNPKQYLKKILYSLNLKI